MAIALERRPVPFLAYRRILHRLCCCRSPREQRCPCLLAASLDACGSKARQLSLSMRVPPRRRESRLSIGFSLLGAPPLAPRFLVLWGRAPTPYRASTAVDRHVCRRRAGSADRRPSPAP